MTAVLFAIAIATLLACMPADNSDGAPEFQYNVIGGFEDDGNGTAAIDGDDIVFSPADGSRITAVIINLGNSTSQKTLTPEEIFNVNENLRYKINLPDFPDSFIIAVNFALNQPSFEIRVNPPELPGDGSGDPKFIEYHPQGAVILLRPAAGSVVDEARIWVNKYYSITSDPSGDFIPLSTENLADLQGSGSHLEISFKRVEYTVTIESAGGTTTPTGTVTGYYGDVLRIDLIPDEGLALNWIKLDEIYLPKQDLVRAREDGYYAHTITSNVTIHAEFSKNAEFTIEITGLGEVYDRDKPHQPNTGGVNVPFGTTIVLEMVPGEGYALSTVYFLFNSDVNKWLSPQELEAVRKTGMMALTMDSGPVAIRVVFEESSSVKVTHGPGGTARVTAMGAADATVGIFPEEGRRVKFVTVNGVEETFSGPGPEYSISVPLAVGAMAVHVEFEGATEGVVAISYVEVDYNCVFKDPVTTLQEGSPLTVSVVARLGHLISKVEVNGRPVEWDGWDGDPKEEVRFTLPRVTSDTEIKAFTVPKSNVYLKPFSYDVTVRPGGEINIGVVAWNNNKDLPVRVKMENVTLLSDTNQEVSFNVLSDKTKWISPKNPLDHGAYLFPLFAMKPLDMSQFDVKVKASRFSSGGVAFLSMTFVVMENPDAVLSGIPERVIMQTCTIAVSIAAGNFESESYGKFLGLFVLPGDIDPFVVAVATALVWFAALAIATRFTVRNHLSRKSDGRTSHGKYAAVALLALAVLGIALSFFVAGGSNRTLETVRRGYQSVLVFLAFLALLMAFSDVTRMRINRLGVDSDSYTPLLRMLGQIGILFAGFYFALIALGADPFYVLASLGVLSLAISMGAAASMGHLFHGLSMLSVRHLSKGDTVMVKGVKGPMRVLSIGALASKFRSWANSEVIYMPNTKVAKATVVNIKKGFDSYKETIYVDVAHGTDIGAARTAIGKAVASVEDTAANGRPPTIRVEKLDSSGVVFKVMFYTSSFDTGYLVAGRVREAIVREFRAAGVEIPFKQTRGRFRTAGPGIASAVASGGKQRENKGENQ